MCKRWDTPAICCIATQVAIRQHENLANIDANMEFKLQTIIGLGGIPCLDTLLQDVSAAHGICTGRKLDEDTITRIFGMVP